VDRNDPRAKRTRDAVTRATADLIAADGLGSLTIERVAEHAGVSRTTLYRHFADLDELIAATVDALGTGSIGEPARTSATSDPLDQIRRAITNLGASLRHEPWGSVVAALAESGHRSDELGRLHRRFTEARRRPVLTVVRRAQQQRRLTSDVSAERIVDLLAGPIYYRHLILHRTMTSAEVTAHIDGVVMLLVKNV
jgi:AcrR family transcriptional regulator